MNPKEISLLAATSRPTAHNLITAVAQILRDKQKEDLWQQPYAFIKTTERKPTVTRDRIRKKIRYNLRGLAPVGMARSLGVIPTVVTGNLPLDHA